jgi:hypothetical protein
LQQLATVRPNLNAQTKQSDQALNESLDPARNKVESRKSRDHWVEADLKADAQQRITMVQR